MSDIKKEWNGIFKSMDNKDLKLDENDIATEIKAYRKMKHKKIRTSPCMRKPITLCLSYLEDRTKKSSSKLVTVSV